MMHLFNKIYLKGDHLFKDERDCIIISPTLGDVGVLGGKFLQLANDTSLGKIFYQAKNYQELLDRHFNGNDQAFFEFLLNFNPSKRLTIYVDVPTALYLMTRFYKSVLPYLTVEAYLTLIKLTFLRVKYLFGAGYLPFFTLTQQQMDDYRTAASSVLEDTDKLRSLWTTTERWRLLRAQHKTIIKGIGVEFQLATYLTFPNWSERAAFENKALQMVKKTLLHDFVFEVKGALLRNFVMLKRLEPQANFNPVTDTLEDFVAQCPDYKFLLDENFMPDNFTYIWQTYSPEKLAKIRDRIFALADTHNRYVNVTTPVWKKNITFKQVVDYELSTNYTKVMFNRDNYDETVNSYLIDCLLNAKRRGDGAFLQQFALVRG